MVELRKARINRFALPMMNVVYLVALIGVIIFCIKTKREKRINAFMTFITIATFVICVTTILSTGAGYYEGDDFLGFE